MNKLYLDFESRSRIDLTKAGLWAYASDPSTDIICLAYALDDGPVRLLTRTQIIAGDPALRALIANPAVKVVAHNSAFEHALWFFIMERRYGWPSLLAPERWDCTMARALACGLPASLFGLGLALRLPMKKDIEARAALMKICKPRLDGTFNEDPELYEIVYKYCGIDVEVERAADKLLPDLSANERKIFETDLRINRRGVLIDLGSARKAAEIAGVLTDGLNADLRRVTGGAVTKASRVAELKRWIAAQGVIVPTKVKIDKETNEETIKETIDIEAMKDLMIDPATPALVKKVISIRQQVGKSSVAKLKTMLLCACADGRFRGAFQFNGAHTTRWAGRLLQLQNFPQGLVGKAQAFAGAMLNEGAGFFCATFGDQSMQTLSDLLRWMLMAAPGKVFLGGDLNAIECRVLNWLAGEQWVLDLFARGDSPYLRMAEAIYEKRLPKTSDEAKKTHKIEYEIGKRSELGGGFGMGWVRFQASTYTETSKKGEGVWLEDELSQKIIKTYRQMHPKVVEFWYATEAAAINAVKTPGWVFSTADGRILWSMSADRRFLCAKVPSGELLRYYKPTAELVVTTRCKKADCPHVLKNDVQYCPDKKQKMELRYWTSAGEGAIRLDCMNTMGQYRTWGGELVENVVQKVARDILAHGMLNVEAAGYPVVLHAHDELVSEVDEFCECGSCNWCDTRGQPTFAESTQDEIYEFEKLMCKVPDWAVTLPVKAEGFCGARYRK